MPEFNLLSEGDKISPGRGALRLDAAGTLTRGNGQNPEFNSLFIPGSAGMSLVTTCCYDRGGGPLGVPQPAYSSSQLVVRSTLQLAIVTTQNEWTAWVTDTADNSKFVEGAKVQVWMTTWSAVSGLGKTKA
jgi:hypothetical protein